jgi:hypothetical protein
MKPSERIKQLAQSMADDMAAPHRANLTQRADALPFATAAYLDEEAERRAKFEAEVLERLAKLEADRQHAMGGGLIGYTEHTDKVYGLSMREEDPSETEGHKQRDTGGGS